MKNIKLNFFKVQLKVLQFRIWKMANVPISFNKTLVIDLNRPMLILDILQKN